MPPQILPRPLRALGALSALSLLASIGFSQVPPLSPIHVDTDATGANNGSSWSDAYTDLQSALAAATADTEIWVAAGVYKPTATSDRSIAFKLKTGVTILGGFAGTETEASQRNPDPTTNGCILSGDLAGDDQADFVNVAENSYHVVDGRGATGALLDGFKIQGGFADTSGSFNERGAGAVFSSGDSATLKNLWFHRNKSAFGGAVYTNVGTLGIAACIFTENEANYGGAIYFNQGSHEIQNTRIYANHANIQGGAITAVKAVVPCFGSILAANTSEGGGGALDVRSSGRVELTNCNVIANTSSSGTTAFLFASSGTVWLRNSIMLDNSLEGGDQFGSNAPAFSSDNVLSGSDIFVSPRGDDGIAGTLDDDYQLAFPNPAIGKADDSLVPHDLLDLDADGNVSEDLPIDMVGASRLQGGRLDIGALESDRAFTWFVDATQSDTPDGLTWATAFPSLVSAIASAEDGDQIWVATGLYLPGDTRESSFVIDNTVKVLGGFTPGDEQEGQRNPNPFTNGCILSGDIGVLGDHSDNAYHVVTLSGADERELRGFAIRHGNADGPSFSQQRGGGINSSFSEGALLDNLLIEDNRASRDGGGIMAQGSLRIFNSTLRNNHAANDGGGISLVSSSGTTKPAMQNLVFAANRAENRGGGLHLEGDAELQLSRLAFFRNQSGFIASALYSTHGASLNLSQSIFAENLCDDQGSAIRKEGLGTTVLDRIAFFGNGGLNGGVVVSLSNGASNDIYNSIFAGNRVFSLIGSNFTTSTIANCTLVLSPNDDAITGIEANVTLSNSIVLGEQIREVFDDVRDSTFASRFNLIQGEDGFADPMLRRLPDSGDGDWLTYSDNDYGDLSLLPNSPAIDAGSNPDAQTANADYAGGIRRFDDPSIDDTGDPGAGAPIVDIGAYEGALETNFWRLYPALFANGDLNGDGLTNYQSYAHGGSPFSLGEGNATLEISHEGEGAFAISHTRRTDSPALRTYYSLSSDLRAWTLQEESPSYLDNYTTTPIDEYRERVTATIARQTLDEPDTFHIDLEFRNPTVD